VGLLLSKLATALVQPVGLSVLLLAFSLARWRRLSGRIAVALAAAILWTSSVPAVSSALRRPLESRHPPRPIAELPAADVILVLGGGIEPPAPPRLRAEVNLAGDRALFAAALYRAGKAPRVLVSGGAYPWQNEPPDSHATQRLLEEIGVPASAVTIGSESRSTRENCLEAREILGEARARVLLVTSALHMPRALGTCRAAGLDVVPATTDVEVLDDAGNGILCWLPDSETLDATSRAWKEVLGIAVYRARGWLAVPPGS
jgi:uncharacterized SAM-binding protein YcdF (DUF218 family)